MHAAASAWSDTGIGPDFYLESLSEGPLLSAQEEREADLRKWAAIRACLRLLASQSGGRELLAAFCKACLHTPPVPETFEVRSTYFHLRKDIGGLLPGKPGAVWLAALQKQIGQDESSTVLAKNLNSMALPATLVVGLAVVYLRAHGLRFPDASADALSGWMGAWRRPQVSPHSRLVSDLHHAVLRYLANRDRLVTHNLRLVLKLAREHQRRGIPLRDLVQEGSAGLVRAAEKFDYRRGYRFTTYAYNWINQYIQRACEGNGSLISYPAHVHQQINQVHRVRMEHVATTGDEPALEELSARTGFPLEKVRELRSRNNITLGLDQPLADDRGLTMENTLPDPAGDRTVRGANEALLSRLVERRLGELEVMERQVVQGRYGLLGQEPQTLRQLAEQLDISSEWARQLEKSALAKLRGDSLLADAYEDCEI